MANDHCQTGMSSLMASAVAGLNQFLGANEAESLAFNNMEDEEDFFR
jgi:hypothetical protein